MTVLCDRDIKEELENGELDVSPVDLDEQLQPNSLDIRLGRNFSQFMDRDEPIDCSRELKNYDTFDFSKKQGEAVIVESGDFLLCDAIESFDIPDYLYGQLHGRSSIGRLGIEIHSTAGLLDSGYSGDLVLEVCNNSNRDVKLYSGMRIAQVVFHELSRRCESSYSSKGNKYQNQEGVVHSRMSEEL